MTDRHLSAISLEGVARLCEHDGISADLVLGAGGVDLEAVRSPGRQVLRSQGVAVMSALAEASPDPGAAFRAGLLLPIEDVPDLARVFTSAPDLRALVGPLNAAIGGFCGGLISLTENSAFARLGYGFPYWNISVEEAWQEAAAGALVSALRLRFGPAWKPIAIVVGHRRARPETVETEGMQFIRGAPDNALALDIRDLDLGPRRNARRSSGDRAAVAGRSQDSALARTNAVRRVIYSRLLLSMDTGIDHVSRIFGISSRSLKRQLASEGRNFSAIVEAVRLEEAKRLLAETDFAVTEIAGQVGYEQTPSFTRAFKRLTGGTPTDFRRHGQWPLRP